VDSLQIIIICGQYNGEIFSGISIHLQNVGVPSKKQRRFVFAFFTAR